MDRLIKIVTGLAMLLLGCLMVLDYVGLSGLSGDMILSITFVFYGLLLTAVTFGQNRNGMLFLASVSFLYGVFLYVTDNYVIFQTSEMYIPSILFIAGAALLIIFLQDFKNIPVLLTAITLIAFSVLVIETGMLSNVYLIEKSVRFTKSYWPLMLIIIGLSVLTRKK